jgi:hypothetical protein
MSQLIDRYTGAIRFDRNMILTPGLLPDELIRLIGIRATGSFMSKSWFMDNEYESEFGPFIIALYFKKDSLYFVEMSLHTTYGSAGALVKSRHDDLMLKTLGKPTRERPIIRNVFSSIIYRSHGQSWHTHAKELTWEFPWGWVKSTIEVRDGASVIQVRWNKHG